jgi:serine/threonine protein kinase
VNSIDPVERQKSFSLTQIPKQENVIKINLSFSCPTANKTDKTNKRITKLNPYIKRLKIADVYGLTINQTKTVRTCGLKVEEVKELKKFYTNYALTLDCISSAAFVSRHSYDNLPFSAVLIPSGSNKKGIYALLKTHRHLKEINFGAYNKATWALNLETFNLHVFRSARVEDVCLMEREINDILSEYSQYFVTGSRVFYNGNWRNRQSKNDPLIPKQNIEKIGFIMDYEGEDLWAILNDRNRIIGPEIARELSQKYAETLGVLHQLNIVHGDQKPENLFFKDKCIKLGDFGFATMKGNIRIGQGTPGYIAPEIILCVNDSVADPATDIWGMGCVLADLFRTEWTGWWKDVVSQDQWQLMTNRNLEKAKGYFFPERKNLKHPHYIIDQCLQLKPEARPSAIQIEAMWKSLRGG